jgi:chromosome segregation ATPase
MPDSPFAPSAAVSAPGQPSGPNVSETIELLKSDLLTVYRAVIALEKRVNESTVNMLEVKPQLIALKVHSESFPSALRELKRSQAAAQHAISELEARLRSVELRFTSSCSPPAIVPRSI